VNERGNDAQDKFGDCAESVEPKLYSLSPTWYDIFNCLIW